MASSPLDNLLDNAAKYEEEIWKLPGLDFQQFFAASYYLDVVQRQQKSFPNTTPAFDVDHLKAELSETRNLFLDLLSLLFARIKKKQAKTPGNVTASALVLEQNRWKIWIAKNAGPYGIKGVLSGEDSDEKFLEDLQNWIRAESIVSNDSTRAAQRTEGSSGTLVNWDGPDLQEPNDPFWSSIVKFWDDRITHDVREIQNGFKLLPMGQKTTKGHVCAQKIGSDEADNFNASDEEIDFDQVEEFFETQNQNADKEALREDWNKAIQMSKYLEAPDGGGSQDNITEYSWILPASPVKKKKQTEKISNKLQFKAFAECYRFRNRERRQLYPLGKLEGERDSSAKAYRHFRQRIKNLEMLGTLLTIWKVFNRVRDDLLEKKITVDLNFVPAFLGFALEKEKLAATIQNWSGLEKSDFRSKVLEGLQPVNTKQGISKPFTRYYHCELQLLCLLHSEEAAGKTTHPYIGVSKLSCHFCWQIISHGNVYGVQYHTKAGHHQISANCAFPFDITGGYGYIPEALAQLQSAMLRSILREAVRIKHEYTVYSKQDQTELISIPESFASQSIQLSKPKVQPPQFRSRNDSFVDVEGLKLGAIDGLESRERVRLLDGETLKPLLQHELVQQIRSPHFPIPELEDGFRYDHWSGAELKLRVGGNISSFEAYYRLRGKHSGNRWAFKRTSSGSSLNLEPWRLDQYLFRGDIWVFKVNLESPLYYQDIGDASPEDLDYFNFRFPVSDDRRDTAQKEISLFWDERKKEIERKLILYLRKHFEPDEEPRKNHERQTLELESDMLVVNPTDDPVSQNAERELLNLWKKPGAWRSDSESESA